MFFTSLQAMALCEKRLMRRVRKPSPEVVEFRGGHLQQHGHASSAFSRL